MIASANFSLFDGTSKMLALAGATTTAIRNTIRDTTHMPNPLIFLIQKTILLIYIW